MPSRRQRIVWKCVSLALLVAPLAVASPAAAETVTVTRNFTTPGESTFVVPRNVTSVEVDAVGADGGSESSAAPGGRGAEVIGTLEVTPGETLYPEVDLGGGRSGGATAGNGGGFSSLSLCSGGPTGEATCGSAYGGIPWYLSQVIVAAGGGGASAAYSSHSVGGAGGLLGGAGGSGGGFEGQTGGQGGGAGLESTCAGGGGAFGEGGAAAEGTTGLSVPFRGIGGSGGTGTIDGGGGGGGYFGGCGGGAGAYGVYAGGAGGGGASFLNNPALKDYFSAIPSVTGYFSFTHSTASSGSVSLTFEDSNFPTPQITYPASDQQVGSRPRFVATLDAEADASTEFGFKIEQTGGVEKNGTPFVAEGSGSVPPNGQVEFGAAEPMPTGRFKATVTQSLVDGANARSKYVVFDVDAEPPALTLTSPADGSYATRSPVVFAGVGGTEPKDERSVTVEVVRASEPFGAAIGRRQGSIAANGEYLFAFGEPLPDGTYLARATQHDNGNDIGVAESTFTVDTVAPKVSLTAPTGMTSATHPTFSGQGGAAPGDLPVEVTVYSGSAAAGTPLEQMEAPVAADGSFAVESSKLLHGTYTAVASQADRAGNEGTSTSLTFEVEAPSRPEREEDRPKGGGTGTPTPSPRSTVTVLGPPTVAGGKIHLTLGCSRGTGSCAIALTGTTGEKLSGKRVETVAAKAPKHGKTVTVASVKASLSAGARRTLTLPLNRLGQKLLARFGKLPVELRVAQAATGTSVLRSVVVRPRKA